MNDPCICLPNNNLDFVISFLDKSCSLDTTVEVYDCVYEPIFTYDAIAEYVIHANIWKQIFQIQINDFNLKLLEYNNFKLLNSTFSALRTCVACCELDINTTCFNT